MIDDTVNTLLIIRKINPDILFAKEEAEREYDRYFEKLHPYITRVEIVIAREMYLAEGCVGYIIRVHITAPVAVMQRFHHEAGVKLGD